MTRSQIHLYAAYIVTWAVHIAYLLFLWSKAARLKREADELEKN